VANSRYCADGQFSIRSDRRIKTRIVTKTLFRTRRRASVRVVVDQVRSGFERAREGERARPAGSRSQQSASQADKHTAATAVLPIAHAAGRGNKELGWEFGSRGARVESNFSHARYRRPRFCRCITSASTVVVGWLARDSG